MKKNTLIAISFCLFLLRAEGQGPFINANANQLGRFGFKWGTTLIGLLEASVLFNPQFNPEKEAGYIGSELKFIVHHSIIREYDQSNTLYTLYWGYKAGSVLLPKLDPNVFPSYNKTRTYGGAPFVGAEFIYLNTKYQIISIPFEVGYGKLGFNQDLTKVTPGNSEGYVIKPGFFVSAGLKFYYSKRKVINCEWIYD